MIRILQVIGSLDIGGSQTLVLNIYKKIDRTKVQFDFLIDKPKELTFAADIKKMGGKIYKMPTFTGFNYFEVRNKWDSFFNMHPEYKIIHFHIRSYISLLIPIAKKHGLFVISHSHSISNGFGIRNFIKDILQYPIRYQADYFLACSREAGEYLFGKRICNSPNFKVVRNAIMGEKFYFNLKKRKYIRKKLKIDDDCFVIGNVGRLVPQKNQEFILNIFAELSKTNSNMKLIFVGDGELKNQLKKNASNLKILDNCLFIGAKKDVSLYYQAMDVFLFPSKNEGLGISAVEAQASGLPTIISKNVPREVDINAGLIKSLSLNISIQSWVSCIRSCYVKIKRKNTKRELNASGYNIDKVAKWFMKFYTKYWDNKGVVNK